MAFPFALLKMNLKSFYKLFLGMFACELMSFWRKKDGRIHLLKHRKTVSPAVHKTKRNTQGENIEDSKNRGFRSTIFFSVLIGLIGTIHCHSCLTILKDKTVWQVMGAAFKQ